MDHHKIQHQILGTAASEASSLSAGCDRSTMSPLMYFSYEARSKWPWPHMAIRMTFSSPVFLHSSASRIAAAIACVGSGAGMMPSVRANCNAAVVHQAGRECYILVSFIFLVEKKFRAEQRILPWKHSVCCMAMASMNPSSYTCEIRGAMPW